jgi:hypothetical protein
MKQLLIILAWQYSSHDIYRMRNAYQRWELTTNHLPKFTIDDNKLPVSTEYYLQYTGVTDQEDSKKFTLFDILWADDQLNEEISNSGFEDLCDEYNIDFTCVEPILIINEPNKPIMPISTKLVFNLKYIGQEEPDLEIDLRGYLSPELNYKFTKF